MQTLLITSKDKQKLSDYINSLCKDNKINKIDIHINSFEKAIGIEDIRNFQKSLFLKPISSPTKLIVLEAYQGITTEAQNALLKVFEEPPNNTLITLGVESNEGILPTVLSRCKIIDLTDKNEQKDNNLNEYNETLMSLSKNSIADNLKLAQDITKAKDKTPIWFEKIILTLRKLLIDKVSSDNSDRDLISKYLNILISFNKTYSLLKTTNTNPRLALENLFLSISN